MYQYVFILLSRTTVLIKTKISQYYMYIDKVESARAATFIKQ